MNGLLELMAAQYASAASYVDEGVVTTTILQPGRREVVRRPFSTAFERPHRFHYRFTDERNGDQLTITQESPPARLTWTVGGQEQVLSLPLAIASATGISGGSALTIPRLLMPQLIPSWALTDLEGPAEEGTEAIEGVDCARLRGLQGGAPMTIWIGLGDRLVRRIFQAHHFPAGSLRESLADVPEELRPPLPPDHVSEEFDTETDTIYRPRRNVALAPAGR
jgi:hypothetical protein